MLSHCCYFHMLSKWFWHLIINCYFHFLQLIVFWNFRGSAIFIGRYSRFCFDFRFQLWFNCVSFLCNNLSQTFLILCRTILLTQLSSKFHIYVNVYLSLLLLFFFFVYYALLGLLLSHNFNLLATSQAYFVHVDDSVTQKVRFSYVIYYFFRWTFLLSEGLFWSTLSCNSQTRSDLNLTHVIEIGWFYLEGYSDDSFWNRALNLWFMNKLFSVAFSL